MVAELSSLKNSVSSQQPRWIQISTSTVEKRFGDSLERKEIQDGRNRYDLQVSSTTRKITGLVEPFRAGMDEILSDDGPDRRRSFTVHRGTFLLQDEELVQEPPTGRPEVSPRRKPTQEVDPRTPGSENWRLSESGGIARLPQSGFSGEGFSNVWQSKCIGKHMLCPL